MRPLTSTGGSPPAYATSALKLMRPCDSAICRASSRHAQSSSTADSPVNRTSRMCCDSTVGCADAAAANASTHSRAPVHAVRTVFVGPNHACLLRLDAPRVRLAVRICGRLFTNRRRSRHDRDVASSRKPARRSLGEGGHQADTTT